MKAKPCFGSDVQSLRNRCCAAACISNLTIFAGSDDETVMIWSLESVSARDRDDEDGIDVKANAAEEILPVNLGPAFDVRFRPNDEASHHHHDNGSGH